MKKKKILIAIPIVIVAIIISVSALIMYQNKKELEDYFKIADQAFEDFEQGVIKQDERIDKIDDSELDSPVSITALSLSGLSAPFLDLYASLSSATVPLEVDIQEFHNEFIDIVSDYRSESERFAKSIKKRDEYGMKESTEKMSDLVYKYKDLKKEFTSLKEKYE
ncbi:hypothetical protein DXB51_14745 [Bacillus cereus]|uniref:Uncharacterized protein n=1 Tax=Bacillus luti TaxID=2026191 RepID=A0ABU8HXG0_9BACI|nr:hypothetical protein [Bacillus luti]RGN77245.1 hypothetical protein DXB51_14745 [Bacillus cereus]